jgi:hypothetical protein
VIRAALAVAAVSAFTCAMPAAGSQPRAYGRELVATLRLPADAVARYAAPAGPGTRPDAPRERAGPSEHSMWVGPLRQVGSGHNPYTLVLTVDGVARVAGDVRTKWQAGWEVRESPTATREVLMAMDAVAPDRVMAGTPVTLTAVGTPVSFRGERDVAPMLNLVSASNLDIGEVQLQLWSGSPPLAWPGTGLPRSALLAVGAFCLLAWWGLRRPPRRAAWTDSGVVATPSQIPSTLPPPLTLPPMPMPLPLPEATTRQRAITPPPAATPLAATPTPTTCVIAALQQVLTTGLAVNTELDPSRKGRRGPHGAGAVANT